jgi:hypothetical protein
MRDIIKDMNKKGFEFSFGWMFAVIVGAAILSLAIYGAVKLIDLSKYQQQSAAGKEFGILLNPVEAGFATAEVNPIDFPVRTRVYNNCEATGTFGKQLISTSIQSGIGKKWENPSAKSTFYNKYIFSASTIEGKKIYAFSKSFNFPFKVADLVYLYSADDKYCFVDAPTSISDDITDFNTGNFNITTEVERCPKGSKKVCFSDLNCDITVNLNAQTLKKFGQTLYFSSDSENELLYGAIFSDPGIYECQIKRLMKRTSELASIYITKSEMLSPKGCNTGLETDLLSFGNKTRAVNSSVNLRDIELYAQDIGRKNNELSACKLY